MKILWVSNHPKAPSGYGSQTRQVGRRIVKAGFDVEFMANDGTRGDDYFEGHLVRGSSGTDRYSRDSVLEDLTRSEADWVISLYDAWVYTENMRDPFEGVPRIAGWVPVDHFPVPISLYGWLQNEHMAIAMSQYGFDRLSELADAFRELGKRPFAVRYAPHAIDDVFRPVSTDFRDTIDVPEDAFLVGIVAANTGTGIYDRKGFGDMAAGLARFMDRHADAYVYLHTIQSGAGLMDIPALLAFKQVPVDRVRWCDQYVLKKHQLSDQNMAEIYSSLSLLLSTSRGEGFGLPVIEAQACGIPVIASNWTAQAELVGNVWTPADIGNQVHPSGWLVGVDPDYDQRQGGDWGKPRIASIIGALETAYAEWREHPDQWQTRKQAAITKAEGWRADAVFEKHWKPILEEMEAAVPIPLNREQRRRQKRAG